MPLHSKKLAMQVEYADGFSVPGHWICRGIGCAGAKDVPGQRMRHRIETKRGRKTEHVLHSVV
jgi:hypothetical protein